MSLNQELIKFTQDIARLRGLYNVTQKELAGVLQVSVTTLSRWENNSFQSIKLSDLIKLIRFFEDKDNDKIDHTFTGTT